MSETKPSAFSTARADRDVVLEACKQNGEALRFASDDLKLDPSATMSLLKSSRTTNHACTRRLLSLGQSESTGKKSLTQPPASSVSSRALTRNCKNVNDSTALYAASPTAASAVAAADVNACAVAPVVKSRHKKPNYRIAIAFRPATDSELATIVALDKVMVKEMMISNQNRSNSSKPASAAVVEPLCLSWLQQRAGSMRKAFANWHALAGVVPAEFLQKSGGDELAKSVGLGNVESDVAEVDVGFVVMSHEVRRLRCKRSHAGGRRPRMVKYLEVFWIAVKEEWQGKGLGEALLLEAIRRARLADPALKEVSPDRLVALLADRC